MISFGDLEVFEDVKEGNFNESDMLEASEKVGEKIEATVFWDVWFVVFQEISACFKEVAYLWEIFFSLGQKFLWTEIKDLVKKTLKKLESRDNWSINL